MLNKKIFKSIILQIMIKWRRDPVYVAFDTTSTPVWQVPFPAVTICNMNMANIDMVHQVRESFETNGSDLMTTLKAEVS